MCTEADEISHMDEDALRKQIDVLARMVQDANAALPVLSWGRATGLTSMGISGVTAHGQSSNVSKS